MRRAAMPATDDPLRTRQKKKGAAIQRAAVGIGPFVRWVTRRSPDLMRRVIIHVHRPLVGDATCVIDQEGFKIGVNPQDNCGGSLYYSGEYEPLQSKVLRAIITESKPSLFLDIGANIGYYSLLAASHGVARIIAFEPSPAVGEVLDFSIRLNPQFFRRISHVSFAASDREGEATFWTNKLAHNYGVGSIIRPADGSLGGMITVRCAPVDSIVMPMPEEGVCVCKIDVEGAEHLVLRGMRETIDARRPTVMLEVHPLELDAAGQSARSVLNVLWERSYTIRKLDLAGAMSLDPREELPSQNF